MLHERVPYERRSKLYDAAATESWSVGRRQNAFAFRGVEWGCPFHEIFPTMAEYHINDEHFRSAMRLKFYCPNTEDIRVCSEFDSGHTNKCQKGVDHQLLCASARRATATTGTTKSYKNSDAPNT